MKYIFPLIILVLIIYYMYSMKCSSCEGFEDTDILDNYKSLANMKRLLRKVIKMLDSKDIKYWVHTEALLGAVENKRIHPWGDTLDICILDSDESAILNLRNVLVSNNLGISEWFSGYRIYDLNGIKLPKVEYMYPFINILVFKENGNKIMLKSKSAMRMWPNEIFNKSDIFPLKKYDFEDIQVFGPNNAKNILSKIYDTWPVNLHNERILRGYCRSKNSIVLNKKKKPYLWQYWDNIDGRETPPYISLCMETVDKHCSKSFQIVRLNKNNIFKFIPELEKYKEKMEKLIIAHKVDIYRILLLHKYGGLYMDADIITLRDPIEIIDKLVEYDFVGFGCTGDLCNNGYANPSNWILASQPNSILIEEVLKKLLDKLETKKEFDYHDLGKLVIWDELEKLITEKKYKYYHYPSKVDGSRDVYGRWVDTDVVFSNIKLEYEDEDNMLFYVFYNSGIPAHVKKMSKEELLEKDWNYTKYLKRGLGI